MANIRDVAKKAGVGIATVSRCINEDGYVSLEVRERIQKAIDELNYKPNALARAIFTKSSMMLGLIIPNIVNPFYPELATGIENRARERGYNIVLSNTEYSKNNEQNIIEMMQRHRVDGIIVANPQCSEEYINSDIPVVSIEKKISKDITFIASDYFKGGELVAEYIIKNNLKKILHIKVPDNIITSSKRFGGFESKLKEKGIKCDIIEGIYGEDISNIKNRLSNYEIVFVWNDDLAISLMSECYKIGLNVPDDIQIIGFDNIYYSSKTSPPLTTVGQSIQKMGETSVDLIIEQIENKKTVDNEHIFNVEFIQRSSTKPREK
ncbi:LacI family DNA-binding transcriptional regulator [Vallitalea maricola]|uniref:Ribose operon transcriptional repressor RbsR n=1 Tax=Vallitalea maricola TaxID=3074433 RepID=A0ACB5UH33_9FIRM|nr:ribose operon transcriptional repressor RbsR [Vallitalea sp. AN17-2]